MSICSTAAPRDSDLPAGLKPLAVTVRTAQELIGIKNTKIWELIGNGSLQTLSIGKRRLVFYASIERLIETLRTEEADRPRSGRADRAIEASVSARRARRASRPTPTASAKPRPRSDRGRQPT
jgi:hypothetical protein